MKFFFPFVFLLFFFTLSAQTNVDIFVINQGNCPYGLTDTYSGPNGAGNMTLSSIDTLGFQTVHHYVINDTVYPINLTVCLYVGASQPPFPPQTPQCINQVLNSGTAITFVADCSVLGVLENNTIHKRKLVSIKNLFGIPIQTTENQIVIYQYDDGTCEKVFVTP